MATLLERMGPTQNVVPSTLMRNPVDRSQTTETGVMLEIEYACAMSLYRPPCIHASIQPCDYDVQQTGGKYVNAFHEIMPYIHDNGCYHVRLVSHQLIKLNGSKPHAESC